jgi:hypothetical protein
MARTRIVESAPLTTTQHPIQTLKFLLLNQVLESRLRMARMRYDQ